MEPKISIITPSFNQGRYLEKTIRSVLDQNYPNLEYIIIDGGSTDNSLDIIKRYEKHLAYWVSEKDRGQSHAINKGMKVATGDLLSWLNSDDYLAPGALPVIADVYRSNPQAGAILGAGTMVDESGQVIVTNEPFEVTSESLYRWIDRFFWQPSCFITRSAWEECGPVDEAIHFAMDLDLWLKIAARYPFATTERMLSSSLKHDVAKTTAFARLSQIDAAIVILKHGGEDQARKFLEGLANDSDAHIAGLVEHCADLTSRLDTCNQHLTELNSELVDRDTKITQLGAEIKQLGAEITKLRAEIELRARDLDTLQRLQRDLSDRDQTVAEMTADLEQCALKIGEYSEKLEKLHLQLEESTRSIAVRDEELRSADQALSEHVMHAQHLLAQTDAVFNSLSWRITKPLRLLGGLLQASDPDVRKAEAVKAVEAAEPGAEPVAEPPIRFNLESISLEDGSEGKVLFVAGWCFSTASAKPVGIEIFSGKQQLSQFTCNLQRDDVQQAFPPEETAGSSIPYCGFQHYVHLKNNLDRIEIKAASTGLTLHRQSLDQISNGGDLRWLPTGSGNVHTSHLRAAREILKKARAVVTWDNVFSLSNWKTWYRCAVDELRWAHVERPMAPPDALSPTEAYIEKNQVRPHLKRLLEDAIGTFSYQPVISIVMPVYNVDGLVLEEAVSSVREQIYPYWELCIADDASTKPETVEVLKNLNAPRIKVVTRAENGHICRASNDAAALATGEFIALMDNDDLLSPNALLEIVRLLQEKPDADLIYSDEDKIDQEGKHFDLHFKPDWSPTLLLGYNYINHLTCMRRTLFEEVGGFRPGYEGAQDYDLLLRLTERTSRVFHIPKILYHWRAIPGSTAFKASEKPIVSTSAYKILSEALERRGVPARIYAPDFARKLNVPVQQLDFSDEGPTVELIIPTFNQGDILRTCIESITTKTSYKNYRIMVVDNASQDKKTLQYLDEISAAGIRVERIPNGPEGFSFSRVNNIAVGRSDAEYILFLNNDTEMIEPLWLSRMMGYLQLPGVGATGARLLYPDNTLQHAGVLLGMGGGFIPDHAFSRVPASVPGYFFLPGTSREASAVTGACLLTRKETFVALGGFDENDFKVSLNDVDYCLKVESAGLSVVYVAGAELYHHESLTRSRQDDPAELANFRDKYGDKVDPYYNPNLSRDSSYAVSPRCTLDYSPYFKGALKVVFFTHNLNHEGAPKIMLTVAEGLQQLGRIRPIIVSPCDGPVRAALEAKGFDVRVVQLRNEANILTSWASAQELEDAIEQMKGLLERWNADVVVTNVINTFFVVEAAARSGIPSLWWIHESYDENLLARNLQAIAFPLAQQAFADASQTIFVSRGTRDLYNRYNTRLNFNVIHNSLNFNDFSERLCEKGRAKSSLHAQDKKVIVSVGTVCDRKDQATIVGAAELLLKKRSDFIIYIVGYRAELPYGDFVKREIEEKGLEDFVVLVPETKDVERYYLAADIFAFCSLNESYSLTILEAMAYGLPVVTTECFGISEQVRFGVNALRIGFKDPTGLAEKLESLLADDKLRKLYGRNSLEMMRYMQTEKEMLTKHEELITAAYQMKEQLAAKEAL